MASDGKDIYRRFESEIRTPKKRLLIDAFLPAPESLESSVAPQAAPPLPVPEMSPEELNLYRRREPEDDEPEPRPEPKVKGKKKPAPKKRKDETSSKSLQEEIAEFMNRDGAAALAPDEDLASFLNNALAPDADPRKKD